jgi:hypothetical protein
MMNDETTMSNNSQPTVPNSPDELFAMQKSAAVELDREDLGALARYIRGEIFPEVNPSYAQILVFTKTLLDDLESYHFDMVEADDFESAQQRAIWKRDLKNITKALMALRKVAEG